MSQIQPYNTLLVRDFGLGGACGQVRGLGVLPLVALAVGQRNLSEVVDV